MKELLLGLRLLSGSGRGNRARFSLMVLGGAIGVCCLAMVLAIPGILAAQDDRRAGREPDCVADDRGLCTSGDRAALELTRRDPYGSRPLTRVFLARGTTPVEPPPGLRDFPAPGDVHVSPRLHEVLRQEPGLSQLLPGKERARIEAPGLARPDELYAYIGVEREELEGTGAPVTHFGAERAWSPTVESSALDIVRFTLAAVVLLPLGVFLAVCARLSAAARARRLAALRLLGLSTKGVKRVNATESVVAAFLGAVLGLGVYGLVDVVLSWTGLPGFTWYPGDGSLSGTTALVCLAGCPTLAWIVGQAGVRRVARNPLEVRRSAVAKQPRAWGLVPLVPGLGIVAGYCLAGATGHPPRDTGLSSILMPLAVVLVGTGLVLTLPFLSQVLARRIARSTQSVSLGLAMRRNELEPGGALRVATGLVLLVFVASLVQGVLIELDQVTKNTAHVQSYDIALRHVTSGEERAFGKVPGVRGHAVTASSWTDMAAEDPPSIGVVVATCGQLRAMVQGLDHCVDGRPAQLVNPQESVWAASKPGAEFPFHLADDQGEKREMTVRVPQQELRFHDDGANSPFSSGDVLLPPSFLPPGFQLEGATLTLVSSSDPETVRSVLDGFGGVAPTVAVQPYGFNVDALEQVAIVKTLLAVGMVLGLIIGVAAYLVAAADRAVERRPQVTALALLGARPRTLRSVQVAQVVLPLAVGLVLAVVLGKMAESSYLVTGGGAIFWDGNGVPLLVASAVGAVGLAALGSLPIVGRQVDPELIRRD
ncbi:ABC transporter permease [Streptomyces phaeoluteigriseus]|uniref:ABC transporter permease n=1 Tax=Streptomyces phaeoluteigriseus TaxID=114686 RepID=A0ABY4ZIU5_9ACTN|nr:FtsX-like permease family protein [Streptomyces phaeoluteigriseus]USQ88197.1 ABC transporter permease [Streptomyces phaeoluteigriseus]